MARLCAAVLDSPGTSNQTWHDQQPTESISLLVPELAMPNYVASAEADALGVATLVSKAMMRVRRAFDTF